MVVHFWATSSSQGCDSSYDGVNVGLQLRPETLATV